MAKKQLSVLKAKYTEAVLDGNSEQAQKIVEEANSSYSISEIYLQIFAPTQNTIGQMWYEGKLNIAGEHLATQITLQQMENLRRSFPLTRKMDLRIVVSSVAGEHHTLGLQMIADFFHARGWDVDFLGSNIPAHDLVEFVRKRHPDMVALSVTLQKNLTNALQTIIALHTLPTCPKIIVGGEGMHADQIPAHYRKNVLVCNATKVVEEAYLFLGISTNNSLEHYLQKMGKKVQALRKNRKWTQQQLSAAANLERTYISSLERGKQNVTIGALLKIVSAMDTSLEELLKEANGV